MYSKILVISIVLLTVSTEDIYDNCRNSLQCVERKLVSYIDRIDEKTVPIIGNLLVMGKTQYNTDTGRSNEDIIERGVRYLSSHELKLRIPTDFSRSLITEGRTRKLKKLILPLLILLKLKAAIIVPAILSVIAFTAFRGLDAGVMALIIAGVTAFKSALESHSHSSKVIEIVPQIATSHWSRTGGVDSLAQGYHTV